MLRREYLIELRENNGLSREEVAAELGLSSRYFKNVEEGKTLSTTVMTTYFIVFSRLYKISVMDLSCFETQYQLSRLKYEQEQEQELEKEEKE